AREQQLQSQRHRLPWGLTRIMWPASVCVTSLWRSLERIGLSLVVSVLVLLVAGQLLGISVIAGGGTILIAVVTTTLSRSLEIWLANPSIARVWDAADQTVPIDIAVSIIAICTLVVAIIATSISPASTTILMLLAPVILLRRRHARKPASTSFPIS